ncbi:hypothetical protein FOXYSP1_05064 [Fusarium oxysporum f. sp. phaseoli]
MLHALIAAQEDDNVSHLWTIHPTGCASLEQSEYSGDIKAIDAKTPVDSVATLTLRSPSDGKPFPVPIREILAKFYEYGQRKLHRNRNKEQLKEIDIIYSIGDEYSRLECQHEYQKLNAQTAFEEHLEIIGNRMRDNGYNIKVHVPDQLVQTEVKYCEELASKSESGSFNLGAYMDEIYFLPLIHSAVLGTIKSGEFAIFEADDTGDIYLRKNHKVDNRFLSTPATKMN